MCGDETSGDGGESEEKHNEIDDLRVKGGGGSSGSKWDGARGN